MVKKLTRHGNSLALVIDKPVLELLNIDADTELKVTTDGRILVVAPAKDTPRQRKFRATVKEVNEKYGRMLKRLAE